jgi:integrase
MYRKQLVEAGRSKSTLASYDSVAKHMVAGVGALRIREARTQRLDEHVRWVAANSGPVTAKKVRVLLSGMFSLAVRFGALQENPVRDVAEVDGPRKKAPKSMDPATLAQLLHDVHHSTEAVGKLTVAEFCQRYDLADVVTLFAATGVRMGEVLGIRWEDVDLKAKTLDINGTVTRHTGVGLVREDITKTEAGERVLPLPKFAIDMLTERKKRVGGVMVFSGRTGLRNPDTVWRQWRQIRDVLGLDWVTPHAFRKTVATILDDEGLTARQAADQLGHAQVSMTSDVYFGRGRTHPQAAEALDTVISKRRVKSLQEHKTETE